MELHPEVAELALKLRRLEEHLTLHGASDWATMISRCRGLVESSDARGLHGFLEMSGEMGSLNDLILQRHGAMLGEENDQLEALRSAAWSLASKLLREEAAETT